MGLKQQLDDLDIPSIIKEEEGHLGKLSLQFVFQSCISFRENIDKFYSNLFLWNLVSINYNFWNEDTSGS